MMLHLYLLFVLVTSHITMGQDERDNAGFATLALKWLAKTCVVWNDPLWDGARCGRSSTCCSFNSPPWFMKQLSSSTSDDLELRVCRDQERIDEDVNVELYVQ